MDRRLNQACRPSATPSSRSSLNCHRNDARIVENGLVSRSGVSKSAKVVLVTAKWETKKTRWRHRGGVSYALGCLL